MNQVKRIVFDVLLVSVFLYTAVNFAALPPKAHDHVPSVITIQSVTQGVHQQVSQWLGN